MIFTPCKEEDTLVVEIPPRVREDDSSESSTLTVEPSLNDSNKAARHDQYHHQQGRRRQEEDGTRPKTKRVVFNERLNVVHQARRQSKEELRERWYTPYEIHNLKTWNGLALRKMQRDGQMHPVITNDNAMEDDITPTTDNNNTSPIFLSTPKVVEHAYQACLGMLYDDIDVLCPDETQRLRAALSDGVFPTGLAAYASVVIRHDVRWRRREVVSMVERLQRDTAHDDDDDDDRTNERAERIRRAVERISRPSRIFARLIAELQAECDPAR